MTKRVYGFEEQFRRQERYVEMFKAWLLDDFGADEVRDATMNEQRQSVDIKYVKGGLVYSVEVKTDFRASETGNMVFEVLSQAYPDQEGIIGWGFKLSRTDRLAYLIPMKSLVVGHIFRPASLQTWVIQHYGRLRNFGARNEGYTTLGVLIPLVDAVDIAESSITLRP